MLPRMELTCPKCGASVQPLPVLSVRCRACGHRWQRVLEGGITFELQRVEGEAPVGPYSRTRIREMLYAGSLTGRERVRAPGSDGGWSPLTECVEFSEVLELLDIQTHRQRRIQGWQSQTSPRPAAGTPPPSAAAPVPESKPASRLSVVIVVGLVVFVGLLYWLTLSS